MKLCIYEQLCSENGEKWKKTGTGKFKTTRDNIKHIIETWNKWGLNKNKEVNILYKYNIIMIRECSYEEISDKNIPDRSYSW